MARRDLSAFFNAGLDYPGIPSEKHPDGKDYRVPSPNGKVGLHLTALADLGMQAAFGGQLSEEQIESLDLDDSQESDFRREVLGPVYDELVEDGVSWELIKHISSDAFLCFAKDQQLADVVLAAQVSAANGDDGESGAEGEAPARGNRADRRKKSSTRTPRKPAGSRSGRASGDTPAQTASQEPQPSSTSPTAPDSASGDLPGPTEPSAKAV